MVIESSTNLCMQWALDKIQNWWISTPPHQWPMKPSDGCINSSDACQPNSPSLVAKPNMILAFLSVDVGNVVALLFRYLDFADVVANQVRKERRKTIVNGMALESYHGIIKLFCPLCLSLPLSWTLYSHNDFSLSLTSETNRQDSAILSLISW